jgi:dTDP-glucose 4,6-dehydratase
VTRSILITGAAGFIGSNLVHHWYREHPCDTVVAYDALTYAGNWANLADVADRIVFIKGDIGDQRLVEDTLRAYRVDLVLNLAAETHNSLAVLDPRRFCVTNVLGTQALLEGCRRVGLARFHQVSTCEVYGDLDLDSPDAFTESSPYRPQTPYNASKASADHLVRAYHATYGLPVTLSSCANNYGPYQFPEKVLPLFITRALNGQQLPMYSSFHHRREWIHVSDHASALERIVLNGIDGESYHVGTGYEASVQQLADTVLGELGLPADLKSVVPDRPGHDRRYLLDSTKIADELGWRPAIGFDGGVRQTIRWYAGNRSWWEPLIGRAPVVEEAWPNSPVAGRIVA